MDLEDNEIIVTAKQWDDLTERNLELEAKFKSLNFLSCNRARQAAEAEIKKLKEDWMKSEERHLARAVGKDSIWVPKVLSEDESIKICGAPFPARSLRDKWPDVIKHFTPKEGYFKQCAICGKDVKVNIQGQGDCDCTPKEG